MMPEARPGGRPLEGASVRELLAQYAAVLEEFTARKLVRTKNAPFGDLAEYCAELVYGGHLARNSTASYDLTTVDDVRVQVKARQIAVPGHRSLPFSPIRSLDFDLCVFLLVEGENVVRAREWTRAEVEIHRKERSGRNDYIIKTGQVLKGNIGVDRTDKFQAAWLCMLNSRGTTPALPGERQFGA